MATWFKRIYDRQGRRIKKLEAALAAAIVYVAHGDLRHFIYWISATVLTATVTY